MAAKYFIALMACLSLCATSDGLWDCKNNSCDVIKVHLNRSDELTSYPEDESVDRLYFQESAIAVLCGGIFTHFSSLKEIVGVDMKLKQIKHGAFADARSLEVLDLRYNLLTKLGKLQFEGATGLRELYLFSNKLVSVHPRAFEGLEKLEKVYLGKNFLKSIAPGTFRRKPNLQVLSLDWNFLTRLDGLVSHEMRSLSEIYVNNNRLKAMDATKLVFLAPKLKKIDINGNKMGCPAVQKYLSLFRSHEISFVRKTKGLKADSSVDGVECLNSLDLEIQRAFGGNEKLYIKTHAGLNYLM